MWSENERAALSLKKESGCVKGLWAPKLRITGFLDIVHHPEF
jgi:hypothetical protein